MGTRRKSRRSHSLFKFDRPFLEQFGCVAGVDEAGRGPLAGPVVAAAVILPHGCKLPDLADSKLLNAGQRFVLYRLIQRCARAIGVGIIDHTEIDKINIYHASFAAMRMALGQLIHRPDHILVDGFNIPRWPHPQTRIIDGDAKSACIAAASIIAKVTRDCLMEALDREFPAYGFKQHKGYSTPEHLRALNEWGPCRIHRRSFAPVRLSVLAVR